MKHNALFPPLILTALTFAVSAQAADTEIPATQNLWVENPTPPPAEQWPDMDYKSVPRPANAYFLKFYKKEDKAFCEEVLGYFNRPGKYIGPYQWAWMINNIVPGRWKYMSEVPNGPTEEESRVSDHYELHVMQEKELKLPDGKAAFAYRFYTTISEREFNGMLFYDQSLRGAKHLLPAYKLKRCAGQDDSTPRGMSYYCRPSGGDGLSNDVLWLKIFALDDTDKPAGWQPWEVMADRQGVELNLRGSKRLDRIWDKRDTNFRTGTPKSDVFVMGEHLVTVGFPFAHPDLGVFAGVSTMTRKTMKYTKCLIQSRFKAHQAERPTDLQ